jgi:hypothetical protein
VPELSSDWERTVLFPQLLGLAMPRFQATRDYLNAPIEPIGGPGCLIFCVVVALLITSVIMHAVHHPVVAPLIHLIHP